MNRSSTLKPIVIASVIALSCGHVAVAQVEWTYQGLVVPPGPPGSWDSSRHQLGDVVFDGSSYHMFLVGGQTSLSWDSAWKVGHWTSNDIQGPWTPDPANPVMSPEPGQWDGYTIYSIAVIYDPDTTMFRMWYGATDSFRGQVFVGYAESANGTDWSKHATNPLTGLDPGLPGAWDDWGIFPNTVLKEGSSYRMWFTAFEYNGGAIDLWRIGTATSSDGLVWSKWPDPVLVATEFWEDTRVYFPKVVEIGDSYGMWYSGLVWSSNLAYIGYAVSPDGLHWGKWSGNPALSPTPGCNAVDSFAAIIEGGTIHGWTTHCYDVAHVVSPFEVLFFDDFETGDTVMWGGTVP